MMSFSLGRTIFLKSRMPLKAFSTKVKEDFANVGEFIDKIVKDNDVVLFIKGTPTAPMCGFSRNVLNILKHQGTLKYFPR